MTPCPPRWPAAAAPEFGEEVEHLVRDDRADFRADPARHPPLTPSGRVDLHSATLASFGYDDRPGHPAWLPPPTPDPEFPLWLVANNPATRPHSQFDHGPHSAAGKVAGREPVGVHPEDAAALGAVEGEVARLRSAVGSCQAAVVLSAAPRPGVVRPATGAWFDPSAPEVATCAHGNPNALTADVGTSRLAQGRTGQHTRVAVERLTGPPPPVRAHEPPPIVPR